ncbi:hypothetical protein Mal4_19200 [Maioricimonas rarisocia]|uniref:Twin-arginine translocation signal domain-containing protein n=1 Tax=Maioricimonas rarisocia TaxID=2528026 RepID=A0A517Z564_9PLAN|nr:hypothetical protein Mal4_19200 [Maioricimonas rarisocia]
MWRPCGSLSRRHFLEATAAGLMTGPLAGAAMAQPPGERPQQAGDVKVINPRARVPLSFIIDDSTCLVNLAHFCIPQFGEVFPDRYQQPWRTLPREIPDSFVRKFGEWCREHGVKGKYSIVPYPALVGWIDKEMPGWSRRELRESLSLVRDFMTVDWDIHPEMVTHTWVINTKTGRPYEERSENYMENWGWSAGRSADELTDYLSYALKLLKNVDLPCEGITTPGGFGNRSREALSEATLASVRDVYGAEIPHYFRHLYTDDRSVAPRVENASGLDGDDPQCVVSIIGCTGDWFGGWDGLTPGSVDRFITADLQGGRLPEVIDRDEPAILVCHWPGIYYNGEELGFNIFKEAVRRVHARYDHLIWMKLSEISRYWAAKELTAINADDGALSLQAPFACPGFTIEFSASPGQTPTLQQEEQQTPLTEVGRKLDLQPQTFFRDGNSVIACFDLPKGRSRLRYA